MFIDLKGLPLIHSYDSIQELNRNIEKHDRGHDLVISSYALGEIPSLSDRITIVRQLWDLTRDVLKCRKIEKSTCTTPGKITSIVSQETSLKNGAFVVAPCPLENTYKYCYFVQRLKRTSSQRAYKRSKGVPLRGFEDEKFCYVALRRGKRPEHTISKGGR
ncbi:hypothetical protein GUJ93_ZPchr0004g38786 [Zizania palustris]|uniref:Uncharacterized protein n=1 Tax=Zizania palustris TaxID=103762 RepID=A0A8J5SEN7_ZIZPA|nr:hypothetical protein GUJ93_ZPchr0004g38786 [Zizania palustris]